MSEDTKQPDAIGPGESDAPTEPDSSGTPPPSAIPSADVLAGADEEKASMVEQAKTRVAAVKVYRPTINKSRAGENYRSLRLSQRRRDDAVRLSFGYYVCTFSGS